MTEWSFAETTLVSVALAMPMFIIGIMFAIKLCDAVNSPAIEAEYKRKPE